MTTVISGRKILLSGAWNHRAARSLKPLIGMWVKASIGVPDRYVDVLSCVIGHFELVLRPDHRGWWFECMFLASRDIDPESHPRDPDEEDEWTIQLEGTGYPYKEGLPPC